MSFTLTSPAFGAGEMIPRRHTCDGENLSPPLAWHGAPPDTGAFAIVMDDPDAPSGTFTHWLLCDLADGLAGLEAGEDGRSGVSGRNDFRKRGYGGPCPPRGDQPHRYRIQLHALRAPLGLRDGFSRDQLEAALDGRMLDTATLAGRYGRR